MIREEERKGGRNEDRRMIGKAGEGCLSKIYERQDCIVGLTSEIIKAWPPEQIFS
jgi:hypothetical protein